MWRICKRNAYELDKFDEYGAELPTFDGSINKQQTLACRPSEEVRAEQKTASAVKVKKKLTEKEKDELFYSVAGAWKDDAVGDRVLDAIRVGRQPTGYERK